MERGPHQKKPPADVTGQAEKEKVDLLKSAAAELGSRGGKARAKNLRPDQRAAIAQAAANARWKKT